MATKTANTTKQTAETPQLSGRLTDAQRELLWVLSLKLTKAEIKELKQVLLHFVDDITQRKLQKYIDNGKWPSDKELATMDIHKLK